jgi:hypothetical protein
MENATSVIAVEIERQRAALISGAGWFYWIAGLSLVNSFINAVGGEWQFLIGLGITQIVDALAMGIAAEAAGDGALVIKAVAFAINLAIALLAVVFGIFANRRKAWAFITGLALFLLDGLILLMVQDWLGVAFHIFAAFCIFRGYSAMRKLDELEIRTEQPTPAPISV